MARDRIRHLNSVDPGKLVTAEQIDYGEFAINYHAGNEIIQIKNSANEIVTFSCTDKISSFMTGVNKVTSLSNIPLDKHKVYAEVNNNQTLSLGDTTRGYDFFGELEILLYNSGTSHIQITIPNDIISFNDNTFTVPSMNYARLKISNFGDKAIMETIIYPNSF